MAKLTDEQKRKNQVDRTYQRYLAWTLGKCKNNALKEFQKLRRLECANDSGQVQCISSGKIVFWDECDAGHYISRKHTITAFSRNNVFPQTKYDNQHLNGNLADYRRNLIELIGLDEVKFLEALQDVSVTLTKLQYAELRECFRAMQKPHKERLGVK